MRQGVNMSMAKFELNILLVVFFHKIIMFVNDRDHLTKVVLHKNYANSQKKKKNSKFIA